MASLIWGGGVHATAVASITTEINACITTNADGTKSFNVAAFVNWVQGQLNTMLTAVEATDTNFVAGLDATAIAQTLANTLAPSHWQTRADWPAWSVTQNQTAAQALDAVRTQQASLKRASDAVATHYKGTQDGYFQIIEAYFEANLQNEIPVGVDPMNEDRVYIATYVTDRGEESAPSNASDLIVLDANDTASVTVAAPPTGRSVTHVRLYRSNTNNSNTVPQYVPNPADDEGWPISTLAITILDDKKAEELQEPCPSLLWDEPPADLQGLVGGANGGMAGIRPATNEVCFSIPYKGYAWPAALRITTETPPVGVASSGQSYFVGTRGRPYVITGTDTTTLSPTKLDAEQACVARRSIVAMGGGFVYASPDGLCVADAGGVKVVTGPEGFNLFDRTAWQALVPSSIFAAESEGCYVFHWDNGSTTGMYSLDVRSGKLITLTNDGSSLYRDTVTDRLYIAQGTAIKAISAGNTKRTAVWRTPIIVLPEEESHCWVQVDSDYSASVTVKSYQDGVLTDTTVLTTKDPQRLPDGLAREWEVQIESAAKVTKLRLASSTEELKTL